MATIPAHGERFDLSATVYFFDGRQRVIQRTFTLRNVEGEGLHAAVEAASELMATVAEELHYLMAAGIDRVAIRADGRDMRELILGLPTRRPEGHFMDAVRFRIRYPHVYFWVNPRGVRRWRVAEEQLSEGWERVASNRWSKAVSFDLPCHAGSARQGAEPDEPFFRAGGVIKHRRTVTGWHVFYDRRDPVLIRFLERFGPKGNLAVGEKRYFVGEGQAMEIGGTFVPRPKTREPGVLKHLGPVVETRQASEYLCVIRMGESDVVQIGRAEDPAGKVKRLQQANPFMLKLMGARKNC
jgi:hypothetical protein